ncbi:uncharacterized protein LOC134944456 [Pseudophryne corroboree]|uniref:uncharacterized protein LOC134944456 n=1 Tax=Pseudophryne corroboree TaxID=495146 RepID=UPI003081A161
MERDVKMNIHMDYQLLEKGSDLVDEEVNERKDKEADDSISPIYNWGLRKVWVSVMEQGATHRLAPKLPFIHVVSNAPLFLSIGYGNGAGQYPGNLQQPGYGAKPSKAGYGAGGYPNIAPQGGYKNGNVGYPNNLQQQGNINVMCQLHIVTPPVVPLQCYLYSPRISGKAGKAGYGNGAGILPSSAGLQGGNGKPSKAGTGYPSNIYAQGLGAKTSKAGPYKQPYSNGLSNFQGKGKGIKSPLSANLGPAGESSKLGAYGQLPYRSQPLAADALGYDPKSAKSGGVKSAYGPQTGYPDPASSKYAGEAQTPYIAQPVPQSALEEEIAPSSSVEGSQSIREGSTPTSPSALTQGPLKGGYQQLGAGQGPWTYAPEESAYGQNGYYGNGYRGCGGKC